MRPAFETVYLWRKGNPQAWSNAFFDSWVRNDPGETTRLTLLLKGFDGQLPALPKTIAHRLDTFHVDDTGFDLTAYSVLASSAPDRVFLFLNSHSRIEAPNWHRCLTEACRKINWRGLVGVSGSWETIPNSNSFPNIHIRTTGFVVRGRDYLEAANQLETRHDCLLFEAGVASLTRYFLRRNLPVVIANSQGQSFHWEDWPKSRTFRYGDQENLLISDNRTRRYHYGSKQKREFLSQSSWGEGSSVTRLSLLEQTMRLLWEKHLYYGHRPRFLAALRTRLS